MANNGAISIVAGNSKLRQFDDLLANVRYDGKYHSIRSLIRPDNPEVREVAAVLAQAPDFISAAREFVNSFTTYRSEVGDYWETPEEVLSERGADCDGLAILLCSLLRAAIPEDKVYCAFGLWTLGGKTEGHMWVLTDGESGEDRILEATAPPSKGSRGTYVLYGIFNDRYSFATDIGLKEFDLKSVAMREPALRR